MDFKILNDFFVEFKNCLTLDIKWICHISYNLPEVEFKEFQQRL